MRSFTWWSAWPLLHHCTHAQTRGHRSQRWEPATALCSGRNGWHGTLCSAGQFAGPAQKVKKERIIDALRGSLKRVRSSATGLLLNIEFHSPATTCKQTGLSTAAHKNKMLSRCVCCCQSFSFPKHKLGDVGMSWNLWSGISPIPARPSRSKCAWTYEPKKKSIGGWSPLCCSLLWCKSSHTLATPSHPKKDASKEGSTTLLSFAVQPSGQTVSNDSIEPG